MNSSYLKNLLLLFGVSFFAAAGAAGVGFFANAPAVTEQKARAQKEEILFGTPRVMPAKNSIKMIFVGDIMLGRNVEVKRKKYGNDYPFRKISQKLTDVDIVFGNLEGPIPAKHIRTPTGSVRFSFDSSVPALLKENNFSVLSISNNHTFDHGRAGYEHTRKALVEAGIDTVGHPREAKEPYALMKKINGRDFVFLAFNTIGTKFDEQSAIETIKEFSQDEEQFIIVSIHWGDEYKPRSNLIQQKMAHKFIDAGVDLIIGHHPHVIQETEEYKGKKIFYSLGNFIFDQYFSRATQEGLMVETVFEVERGQMSGGSDGQGVPVPKYKEYPIDLRDSQPRLVAPAQAQK